MSCRDRLLVTPWIVDGYPCGKPHTRHYPGATMSRGGWNREAILCHKRVEIVSRIRGIDASFFSLNERRFKNFANCLKIEIIQISFKREKLLISRIKVLNHDNWRWHLTSQTRRICVTTIPRNSSFSTRFSLRFRELQRFQDSANLWDYLYRDKRRTCSKRRRGNYEEKEKLQRDREKNRSIACVAFKLVRWEGEREPLEQFQNQSHKSSFESWIAATGHTRTRNARALCIVPT